MSPDLICQPPDIKRICLQPMKSRNRSTALGFGTVELSPDESTITVNMSLVALPQMRALPTFRACGSGRERFGDIPIHRLAFGYVRRDSSTNGCD